ncbi:MAG: outer membrane lipid asymmetry maintenance protein MlaD [Sinobacteraceae bacterium]|nr:outer membrane lipid asymmetry maintenance protein MlaD [Nevskiaceae bacterium]
MRANRTLEIGTGLFVLLGFAALFFLTTQLPATGLKLGRSNAGYHLTASFDNIGDLKVGSPVTMAGVRIGQVDAIRFDPKQYQAVVGLRINKQYNEIPDDSFASIQTEGLLGGKYVGVSPGGSDTYFKDGGHVDQTQSAIVLESLINKLFASFADKSGGGKGGSADKASGAADENAAGSQSSTQNKQGSKK